MMNEDAGQMVKDSQPIRLAYLKHEPMYLMKNEMSMLEFMELPGTEFRMIDGRLSLINEDIMKGVRL
jgi:hypothetical protein